MSDVSPVKVKVLGKNYQVACPAGEEPQVHNAALLLENKMMELRGRGVSFSNETMAIITGLNLAHELLSLQQSNTKTDKISNTISTLCSRVDQILAENPQPTTDEKDNKVRSEAEPA